MEKLEEEEGEGMTSTTAMTWGTPAKGTTAETRGKAKIKVSCILG
jgi:hypothetical protein